MVPIIINQNLERYLTEQPEITYFKLTIKKCSFFYRFWQKQPLRGRMNFDETLHCHIEHHGDLMHHMALSITLPTIQERQILANDQFSTLLDLYANNVMQYAQQVHTWLQASNATLEQLQRLLHHSDIAQSVNYITRDVQDYMIKHRLPHYYTNMQLINAFNVRNKYLSLQTESNWRTLLLDWIENTLYDALKAFVIHILPQAQKYDYCWIEHLFPFIIRSAEIKIQGKSIETLTGEWIYLHQTLHETTPSFSMISLPFWFTQHTGSVLPLCALKREDVQCIIQLEHLNQIFYSNDDQLAEIELEHVDLLIEYILISAAEKEYFMKEHMHLITVIQYANLRITSGLTHTLNSYFRYPTRYVVWTTQYEARTTPGANGPCTLHKYDDVCAFMSLSLGSTFLMHEFTTPHHFDTISFHRHFNQSPTKGIYAHAFALQAHENKLSGHINLSQTPHLMLRLTLKQIPSSPIKLKMYGVSIRPMIISNYQIRFPYA